MLILGINNMHDASATLVADGRVIAAAEEERFTRKKHHIGFPANAIRYCLDDAGIKITDLDAIGVSWKPWVLSRRVYNVLKDLTTSMKSFRAKANRGMGQMGNEWYQLFTMRHLIEQSFGKGRFKFHYLDHHLCHAVSAFYPSNFERSAVLTIDGAGESNTTALWAGEGTGLEELETVSLPHSLGQFYAAVTAFLGFRPQADEYKVMGMASYGEPTYADLFRERVVRIQKDGTFRIRANFLGYHLARQGVFLKEATRALGKNRMPNEEITKRHFDIAKSAQVVVEEVLFHLLNRLHDKTGTENLCMAGGIALNCVANGKIHENTPFRNIFIQPAAGDNGTSLGAALYLYHQYSHLPRRYTMKDAYLGPAFSEKECEAALKSFDLPFRKLPEERLCNTLAESLSKEELVCWFQGRMEWGPRALGNRSLLADPRGKDIKELINVKVKQREPFRPFAPSVLEEESTKFFENPFPSPFMIFAFRVREGQQDKIPAVTHVDGTARPQTVSRETNPRYWRLIRAFGEKTGVPLLLNTSFNVQEPIVCTPRDAISCFLRTEVENLVLGDLLVERASFSKKKAGKKSKK